MKAKSVCSIEGCDGKTISLGWCNKHYKRFRRNGDPNVLVHNFDGAYLILRITQKRGKFYFRTYIPKRGHCWVHRLVMEHCLGRRLTKDEIVHHKDGDGLNNKPDNLELTTVNKHINEHNPCPHLNSKDEEPF